MTEISRMIDHLTERRMHFVMFVILLASDADQSS